MVYTYSKWSIWLQTSDSGLPNTGKTTVHSSSILVRLARGAIPCLLYMFNRPSALQQCCYTSVHVAGWAGVISSDKWLSVIQGRVTNFQWFNCIEMWFHTFCMLTYVRMHYDKISTYSSTRRSYICIYSYHCIVTMATLQLALHAYIYCRNYVCVKVRTSAWNR